MGATSGFCHVLFEALARGSANICTPNPNGIWGRGGGPPSPEGIKSPPSSDGREMGKRNLGGGPSLPHWEINPPLETGAERRHHIYPLPQLRSPVSGW